MLISNLSNSQEDPDIEFNRKVSKMIAGFISNEQSDAKLMEDANQMNPSGIIAKSEC